jgi:hypothetical protein
MTIIINPDVESGIVDGDESDKIKLLTPKKKANKKNKTNKFSKKTIFLAVIIGVIAIFVVIGLLITVLVFSINDNKIVKEILDSNEPKIYNLTNYFEPYLDKIDNNFLNNEDYLSESTTDKVNESTTDKVNESTTDEVNESTTDEVNESTTDKVNESTTDKVNESTTDNKSLNNSLFNDNISEVQYENIDLI